MAYGYVDSKIGVPDVATVSTSGTLGAPWVSTTNILPSVTMGHHLGEVREFWDGTLGQGSFILLAVPTSTAVTVGLLYQFDKNYNVVIMPTNAANSGVSIVVAYTAVTSNASSVQYAWFLVQGQVAVLKTAVVAPPQSGIYVSSTAGRIQFTASAGKQIEGARTANTTSVTTTTSTVNVFFNFSSVEGK